MHMGTWSGIKCPSKIWHSFCLARAWKTGPVDGGCSRRSPSVVVWARIQHGTCSPNLKWAHPAGISLAGEPGLIPIERSFATYNRKTNQYLFPGPFLAHAWHGSTIRETHDLIDSDMWRQGKKHF
jgi:hypothetical protein